MKKRVVAHLGPALALLLCASAAWVVTLVHWTPAAHAVVPFAFLVVVLALGTIFGRTVGIWGSVIAALVFAHSMYQPLGSIRVADQGARSGLAWMLLAGVTVSYLLLPPHGLGGDETKRHP